MILQAVSDSPKWAKIVYVCKVSLQRHIQHVGEEIPKSSISQTLNLQYVEEGGKATYLWETDRLGQSPLKDAVRYPHILLAVVISFL